MTWLILTYIKLMEGKGKISFKIINLSALPLPLKYTTPVPLSQEEPHDLKSLMTYVAKVQNITEKQDLGNLHNSSDKNVNISGREMELDVPDTALDFLPSLYIRTVCMLGCMPYTLFRQAI